MSEFITLIIPFIGTALGASTVFLFWGNATEKTEKALLGFASGVMMAASVWSLIIPSAEMAKDLGTAPWLPAVTGFMCGILFLYLSDVIIGNMNPEGKSKLSKTGMLIFAVTLHNIPEGMAVGVAYAGAIAENSSVSTAAAMALSIGIAIQNLPESAIISLPLVGEGYKKQAAFIYGTLSGIVEPIAGFLTIVFVSKVTALLPYLLAFAAGAMFYVIFEELVPEAQSGEHGYSAILASAIGFSLMMLLDMAFA